MLSTGVPLMGRGERERLLPAVVDHHLLGFPNVQVEAIIPEPSFQDLRLPLLS